MSNLTNAGENLVADFFRAQSFASLAGSLYISLATAGGETGVTEIAGTAYARQPVSRALTSWAGTQGSGTTLASNGTTHATSNNNAIAFGVAGSAWGAITHVGIHTAVSAGTCIAYYPLVTPLSVANGDTVSLPAGAISFSLGLTGGTSDFTANLVIDNLFRGQTTAWPANAFFALFTAAPTNAGGGTEVSGGAYARQSTPFSLAGFSNTTAAGTTTASGAGTGGLISNNLPIGFPTPAATWGTITHEGVFDALSAGNLLFWNPLDTARTVLSGSSPQTHAPASWSITVA